METCASGHANTQCYAAAPEQVQAAHEAGLSYGKYRAFLEAQAQNPDLTVEDVQGMTMREIHDLMHEQSDACDAQDENPSSNGAGHGAGHGWRGAQKGHGG